MALTKITGQVINDTTGLVVGVTTVGGGVSATDGFFSGIVTAVGDASFSGNVSVGGTLTYEDVTNIDAVGLVTARNGIVVGSGITLSKDGDGFFTGVVTATSYAGDGSALTGIAATDNVRTGILDVAGVGTFRNDVNIPDKIIHLGDTDTAIRFPDADTVSVETGGSERVRIDSSGRMGIGDNSPDRELVVKHSSSNSTIKIESANTHTSQLMFADSDGEQVGRVAVFHGSGQVSSNSLTLDTAGTARIRVEPAGNVNIAQNLKVAGVCTATSFSGSGANLTGISAGVAKVAVRRYYGFVQYSSIGNAGFTEISEAYVDITPTSSSNYIKLGGLFCWEGSDTEDQYSFRWKRVITGGSTTSIDATQGAGNRPAVTYKTEGGAGGLICMQLSNIYDLPATTSSVRYYLEVFCDGANQTLYVNRTHADANDPRDERGASYFSAEEMDNSIFTFTNDT